MRAERPDQRYEQGQIARAQTTAVEKDAPGDHKDQAGVNRMHHDRYPLAEIRSGLKQQLLERKSQYRERPAQRPGAIAQHPLPEQVRAVFQGLLQRQHGTQIIEKITRAHATGKQGAAQGQSDEQAAYRP